MSSPDPLLFSVTYEATPLVGDNDYDLSFLLPSSFSSLEVWAAYIESLAKVFRAEIHLPTELLSKIRTPELQGRVYKALHAQMMGMEIPDEIMTDAAYDRLNRHVGRYQEAQGRDNFIKFLAYVLGVRLDLVRLWTKDYVDFSPGHGKPIWEGGDWYPTTHVGINFDDRGQTSITEKHIIDLFYGHAKADLVLKWIARNQKVSLGKLYLGLMALEDGCYRFRLNGVGDFDMKMGLELFQVEDGFDRSSGIMDRGVELGLGLGGLSEYQEQSTIVMPGFYWREADLVPPIDSNIVFARPSQAFMFTGQAKGVWVNVNQPRWDYANPFTGAKMGLLIEKETYNYVRSSTRTDQAPWKRGASLTIDYDYFDNVDGSDSIIWRTPLANDVLEQIVELPAGEFCIQAIAKNLVNIIITPIADDGTYGSPLTFNTSTLMGNGWRHFVTTIPFSGSAKKMSFKLTVKDTQVFYFGIEPGLLPSSPIYSDDCALGIRAGESLYFKTDPVMGAFSVRIRNGLSAYNTTPTAVDQTMLTAYDAENRTILTLVDTAGTIVATLTDYFPEPDTVRTRVVTYAALHLFHINWSAGASPFWLNSGSNITTSDFRPVRIRMSSNFSGVIEGLAVIPFTAAHADFLALGVF